ncbi:MAG: LuxR C-terminal-related transcriptional regulator [Ilumatobacteraceae bacterium]
MEDQPAIGIADQYRDPAGLGGLATSPVLRALVAIATPVPADLLTAIDELAGDLPASLALLETGGLVVWHADGRVEATALAIDAVNLTGADRARQRGAIGRAAQNATAVPVGLVAAWLLEGCRIEPAPDVVPWLLDRADDELRRGHLDVSVDVLSQVVAAIERGQSVSGLSRVRAYLRLGYVLRWLGRGDDARALATRALASARASGDGTELAAAAIAWRPDAIGISDDPSGVALVDEALSAVSGDEIALRARLLAARADALLFSDLDRAAASGAEALELARRTDDAETFIVAAYAYRVTHWHPSRQDETLALGTEMVSVAPRAVDFVEFGSATRLQVFLELGDWSHFDGELAAMGRRLEHAPRPLEVLWWQILQVARAQTHGEWETADRLIAASLAIAEGPEYGTAYQLLLTQQLISAWHRGEDLLPLVDADLLPAGPMRDAWEAGLLGWTCTRRPAGAIVDELDRFLAAGVAGVRHDLTFGPVVSALCMAAAEARSSRHARLLVDAIRPFADQWAGTGGAVVSGPYALHLGRLLGVLGRVDEAMAALEAALASCRAGACRVWEARVELALGEICPERSAARRHAARAIALADALGMVEVAASARRLLGEQPRPCGLTEREAEVLGLLGSGVTNAQIAADLFLSVKTVERHLMNAYRKAGLRNRAEAAAFAVRELAE